jgi:hypothetical protein
MTQQPGTQAPGNAKAIDKVPKTGAEWAAFAQFSPAGRSAAYVRSIRAMVLFFTVLALIGLALGLFLGLRHATSANEHGTTPTADTSAGSNGAEPLDTPRHVSGPVSSGFEPAT